MIARRSPLLAGALICCALIAGCGSSNSTTAGSTTTTSSNAAAATTSTPSTSTKSAAPSTTLNPADLAAAVAECKAVVQHATTLSSSLKSKVEGICNKAASGNVAAARAAAKEVCVEVLNASPIPSAEKSQALAACKAS